MSNFVESILQKVTNQRVYNVFKTFELYDLMMNETISNELINLNIIDNDDHTTLIEYLDGLKIKDFSSDENIEYNLNDPILKQNFYIVNLEIRDDEYNELMTILDKLRLFKYSDNPFLNTIKTSGDICYGGLILNNIPITIITEDQVRELMEITYLGSKEPILKSNDLQTLYEICYNIIVLGVDDTKSFLKTVKSREDVVFLSATMKDAKLKSELDLRNIRWKPKVTSYQSCPICHEKKVDLFDVKQTRSADEPPTLSYRCTSCKHRWNIN